MDEIISWLEQKIEQYGRLETEALSRGHNAAALRWNIRYSHFQEVLDYIRAHCQPERGIGVLIIDERFTADEDERTS